MAIQMAVPSHGGETFVTLIKDANEKFCGPASNFLGLKCDNAGSMKLRFEDVDGTAAATVIDITVTDSLIYEDQIFISFVNKNKTCEHMEIYNAKINFDTLNFKEF